MTWEELYDKCKKNRWIIPDIEFAQLLLDENEEELVKLILPGASIVNIDSSLRAISYSNTLFLVEDGVPETLDCLLEAYHGF